MVDFKRCLSTEDEYNNWLGLLGLLSDDSAKTDNKADFVLWALD